MYVSYSVWTHCVEQPVNIKSIMLLLYVFIDLTICFVKKTYHNEYCSRVQALRGCLVLFSETGDLRFCYLGTDPTIFMAPERPTKDHKDAKNQLVQLKKDLQNVSLLDGGWSFVFTAVRSEIDNVWCSYYYFILGRKKPCPNRIYIFVNKCAINP